MPKEDAVAAAAAKALKKAKKEKKRAKKDRESAAKPQVPEPAEEKAPQPPPEGQKDCKDPAAKAAKKAAKKAKKDKASSAAAAADVPAGSSRKRSSPPEDKADLVPAAKRLKAAEAEAAPAPVVSAEKATKKLTKKLGRAPSPEEVAEYVAKKLRKAAAAAGPAGPGDPGWIPSEGEPPRKGQIPDGKGGWGWPVRPPPTGDGTILLFYGYVVPEWTRAEHDAAMEFAHESLGRNKCTGRLRCAREGFNGTLTGPHAGIRSFTKELREWQPKHFGATDFKYVDKQPDSQMLKDLKVFPVSELVTYGFPRTAQASITAGGKHLSPTEYHKAMQHPDAVMIDVRNFNESVIGKFAPPGTTVLDPMMRRSTEFPGWVDRNVEKLKGKKVLMYCTGGIRCERASAYLVEKGLTDINQLEGGIHRYLESYEEDGGHWVGANYTFDKRFSHGAKNAEVISKCVLCSEPWERYAAQKKCKFCKMEVLVCRTCDRKAKVKGPEKVPIDKEKLICSLCAAPGGRHRKMNQHGVQG